MGWGGWGAGGYSEEQVTCRWGGVGGGLGGIQRSRSLAGGVEWVGGWGGGIQMSRSLVGGVGWMGGQGGIQRSRSLAGRVGRGGRVVVVVIFKGAGHLQVG